MSHQSTAEDLDLELDYTITLVVVRLDAFNTALTAMEWQPTMRSDVPMADGKTEVSLTYRSGTPRDVFEEVAAHLEDLERRHG